MTVAVASLGGLLTAILSLSFATLVLAGAICTIALLLFRSKAPVDRRGLHAVAGGLVAIVVLTGAWTSVRGAAGLPVADLFLLLALVPLAIIAVRGSAIIPLPGWLLYAAGGFLVAAMIAALFVPDPPPRAIPLDIASIRAENVERDSDLAALARLELALLVTPIVIGAVASTWQRARLFADLWFASAVICAGVAVIDRFLGFGIGDRLVGVDWGTRELGLTSHPNQLGLIAAMAVPIALQRLGASRGLARLAVTGGLATLLLGVLVSGSRLGLLAVALALALSFLLFANLRPKLIAASVVTLLLAVAAASVMPGLDFVSIDRISGDAGASAATEDRFSRIRNSLSVVGEYPLTGVGFATVIDAHSLPIQFLQAGGVVALAAFLIFVVGVGRLGWAMRRSTAPPEARRLGMALAASMGVWIVCGLANPQVSERYLYVPLGVLLGLGIAAIRSGDRSLSALVGPTVAAEGEVSAALADGRAQRDGIREGVPA